MHVKGRTQKNIFSKKAHKGNKQLVDAVMKKYNDSMIDVRMWINDLCIDYKLDFDTLWNWVSKDLSTAQMKLPTMRRYLDRNAVYDTPMSLEAIRNAVDVDIKKVLEFKTLGE